VVDISNDKIVPMDEEEGSVIVEEVDEDDENWMDSPALVAPPPPVVPATPVAPTPPASPAAPAPTVVVDIVSPDGHEEEDLGWTTTIHYKYPS